MNLAKSSVNSKENINLSFKILSAIGIIVIVSGHCYHGGFELAYNWFPTYSFNIALFVFISGYFYKKKYINEMGKYIWKRTKRLIIPAYIWNIFYGLFITVMAWFGYTIGDKISWYNIFVMPFVDGEAFQYNLGSWFVYPLFTVCIFNLLFRKVLNLLHIENEYLILIIYTIVGMYGISLAIDNSAIGVSGVMKLLIRSMFFLPCFQFGQFYRCKIENKDTLDNVPYFAILFVIQSGLLLFTDNNLEYTPSTCSGFNNGVIIPYISAITAIAFWLRISKLLVPVFGNSKIVRLIADNTYSIMINHFLGFMCMKWICYFINKFSLTLIFSDFNEISMKSNIWYVYVPKGLYQFAFFYLMAGIFVPIGISLLLKKIYNTLNIKGRLTSRLKKPKINSVGRAI